MESSALWIGVEGFDEEPAGTEVFAAGSWYAVKIALIPPVSIGHYNDSPLSVRALAKDEPDLD